MADTPSARRRVALGLALLTGFGAGRALRPQAALAEQCTSPSETLQLRLESVAPLDGEPRRDLWDLWGPTATLNTGLQFVGSGDPPTTFLLERDP